MAKLRVKNIDQLRRSLNNKKQIVVNKTLRDEKLRKSIGNLVKKDIQDRTWRRAARATQKIRAYMERFNKTSPKYNRNKINITFTGELLKDLASNVISNTNKAEFIIQHSNNRHKPYKSGDGLQKKTPTYKQLRKYLKDINLDYLIFTQKLKLNVAKVVIQRLKKALSKI